MFSYTDIPYVIIRIFSVWASTQLKENWVNLVQEILHKRNNVDTIVTIVDFHSLLVTIYNIILN